MKITVHMHVIVCVYECEFRDEIILRGEEYKTRVNLNFKTMKWTLSLGSSCAV